MKFILTILGIFLISCSQNYHYIKTGKEGSALPEFSLLLADSSNINSKDINVSSTLILFYFSPVCPYCRATLSDILNHPQAFNKSNIYMITSADIVSMKKFIQKYKLDQVNNIIVGKDDKFLLGKYFSIKGVPLMLIYNRNKRLIAQIPGVVTVNDLKTFLNS